MNNIDELKTALRELIRFAKKLESDLDCEFGGCRSVERMEEDVAFSGEIYKAEQALAGIEDKT